MSLLFVYIKFKSFSEKYQEFRILNRVQLAKFSQGGRIRMDQARQPLYDYGDQEYNVRLTVGTPGNFAAITIKY